MRLVLPILGLFAGIAAVLFGLPWCGAMLVLYSVLGILGDVLPRPAFEAKPSPVYGFDGPTEGAEVPEFVPCGYCGGRVEDDGSESCRGCGARP